MNLAIATDDKKARRVRTRSTPLTVAEYLTNQIAICGKTQIEIAEEAGFNKPNIITMLKKGITKLPIAKIGPLAKALGADPLFLYQLAMREYEPETWAVIEDMILHQPVISENEHEIIQVIRKSRVVNPKIRTNEDRARILEAISHLRGENDEPN